jgi:hypothetical protein
MAIYTRFGGAVTICDARMIPVWIERTSNEVKWHYSKPRKPRKGTAIEEMPIWHYRGWYADNGKPVCDNKWIDANSLKADDGWKEIEAKLLELCPDSREKYNQWNKKGAPEASHFFPPISEKEAA